MSDTFTPPRGFGYKPDPRDRRDRLLYAAVPNIANLPPRADNEKILPAPMDQAVTNSCVGFSGAAVLYATMKRDKHRKPFVPSPVFLYREARVLGGYVEEDLGAEIRLMWKACSKVGIVPMSNIKPKFDNKSLADANNIFPENSIWRKQPAPSHYADGQRRQAIVYHRLPIIEDVLQTLANGWCVQLGFTVFRSLYNSNGAPRYDVPLPVIGDRELGGHAVTAYGYDIPSRRILFRNSWGESAHEGKPNFMLPFDYWRWCSDVWCSQLIEGGIPQ